MPEAVAELRQRLQLARKECQQIGQSPPRPAGLRSLLGAIPVTVLRRLMFWYAPAVQRTIGAVTDVVDDALRDLDRMIQQDSARIATLEGRIPQEHAHAEQRLVDEIRQERVVAEQQVSAAVAEARQHAERQLQEVVAGARQHAERQLQENLQQVREQFERQWHDLLREVRAQDAGLAARIDEQVRTLELERATTIGIQGDVREQTEALQQLAEERRQKEEELEARLRESGERLQLVRRETLENAQRLVRLLAQPPAPPEPLPARAPEPDPGGWEALEAALESEIRGTRGEVLDGWRAYLPLMPHEGPVLDLGCGRGEWLELLQREGIAARGVDANRLLVTECRERFLDAEHAAPFDYLARTPAASLGAVTVLRLTAHLTFRELARLVDEVARVLRPGGTAIFESPNPDNVWVAGRDFYRDPARLRPIPSEILRCLVEARGLEPVEVLLLHPAGADELVPEDGEGFVTRRFNRYFYGPRDYAVVCRKAGL